MSAPEEGLCVAAPTFPGVRLSAEYEGCDVRRLLLTTLLVFGIEQNSFVCHVKMTFIAEGKREIE